MNWEEVCQIGREFTEVVEDIWYRTPALKVRNKALCRLREEGDIIVFLTVSVEEQEFLIASRPDIYFITDHYRGWPAVLARLPVLDAAECRTRLEIAYRLKAPKALLKQLPSADSTPKAIQAEESPKRSRNPRGTRKS